MTGTKLSYSIFNLSTAKLTQDSKFPTDTQAFLGHNQAVIRLHNVAQVKRFIPSIDQLFLSQVTWSCNTVNLIIFSSRKHTSHFDLKDLFIK